jgi:hypothetical protein
MTADQPPKDGFYIPPLPPGTPPPKSEKSDTFWILLAVPCFIVMVLVYLGAVAFIFVMAGNAIPDRAVVATSEFQHHDGSQTIIITYRGGQDAGQVVGLTGTITDSSGQAQTKILGSGTGTSPLRAGEELSFEGEFAGTVHVVAVARFNDGKEQVVHDTYYGRE